MLSDSAPLVPAFLLSQQSLASAAEYMDEGMNPKQGHVAEALFIQSRSCLDIGIARTSQSETQPSGVYLVKGRNPYNLVVDGVLQSKTLKPGQ